MALVDKDNPGMEGKSTLGSIGGTGRFELEVTERRSEGWWREKPYNNKPVSNMKKSIDNQQEENMNLTNF